MEVKRYNSEHGAFFELKKGSVILRISYGGNGDLYWNIDDTGSDDELFYQDFLITKDNYFIYNLFDILYDNVINANFSDKNDWQFWELFNDFSYEEGKNRNKNYSLTIKRSSQYKSLVNDGIITWKSEDGDYKHDSIVRISKKDDSYLLEFAKKEKGKADYYLSSPFGISIRFCNSGCTYQPFNQLFMKMYNKLCEYNPDYHQTHIEEYLYQLSLK